MTPQGNHRPPTGKQLRYLRILAERTATTFTPPKSITHAGAEIERLLALLPKTSEDARQAERDARREKHQVQDDLAARPGDSTTVRRSEVRGYGADARWS